MTYGGVFGKIKNAYPNPQLISQTKNQKRGHGECLTSKSWFIDKYILNGLKLEASSTIDSSFNNSA